MDNNIFLIFVDLSQLITLLLHSLHAIPNFILFKKSWLQTDTKVTL